MLKDLSPFPLQIFMKGDEPLGAHQSPHRHREMGGYYQGTLDLQSLQSSWYLRLNMCIEEVYVCARVCAYVCILMCVSIWRPQDDIKCLPKSPSNLLTGDRISQ